MVGCIPVGNYPLPDCHRHTTKVATAIAESNDKRQAIVEMTAPDARETVFDKFIPSIGGSVFDFPRFSSMVIERVQIFFDGE